MGFIISHPHVEVSYKGLGNFRVWQLEKPAQAPPIPLLCFLGLLGRCLEQENLALAVLFILGFWGMLRTGELLKLEFQHILLSDHTVVVQQGRTKTGLRRAIDENVVLYDDISKLVISTYMNIHSTAARDAKIWPHTSTKFREEFKRLLTFFAIERLFRPYSLRRGGATEDFRLHGSMERTLLKGRWGTSTAARHYIQEGLSALTTIRIQPMYYQLLRHYASFYFHDLPAARSAPGYVERPAGGTPEMKKKGRTLNAKWQKRQ